MIYPFVDLHTAGLVVGILLVVLHGIAILHSRSARSWARAFPRSQAAGMTLLAIDAIWAFLMIANMDLGEFSNFRTIMLVLIPVAAGLTLKYVDEFLAVRALGMLLLLAAEPLLEAAFLRPEESRLFLVVLAYVWIVFGFFASAFRIGCGTRFCGWKKTRCAGRRRPRSGSLTERSCLFAP